MCVMSREDGGSGADTVTAIVLAAGAGSLFRDGGHQLNATLPSTPTRPPEPVAAQDTPVHAHPRVEEIDTAAGTVTVSTPEGTRTQG